MKATGIVRTATSMSQPEETRKAASSNRWGEGEVLQCYRLSVVEL
jgi:hypothetical protein